LRNSFSQIVRFRNIDLLLQCTIFILHARILLPALSMMHKWLLGALEGCQILGLHTKQVFHIKILLCNLINWKQMKNLEYEMQC